MLDSPPALHLPRFDDIPPEEGGPTPPPGKRPAGEELPGYRREPFVTGWIDTPAGPVPQVAATLARRDHLGNFLKARMGFDRNHHKVAPGLYAIGEPDADAPVIATCNYRLTFDKVRRDLAGKSVWLLVLDTYGVNVWCAAGKKTFSTEELVRRVKASGLAEVVRHRRVILPQLGAPGVSAREAARLTGFRFRFGPVYSADLPAYLDAGMTCDPAMRTVRFPLRERLAVSLVEVAGLGRKWLWVLLACLVLAGIGPEVFSFSRALTHGLTGFALFAAAFACGIFLAPALLPWLPGRAFYLKGLVTGAMGAGVALAALWGDIGPWHGAAIACGFPAASSWFTMYYTGSTPYTSPSGVEKEMRRGIPLQLALGAATAVFWLVGNFTSG